MRVRWLLAAACASVLLLPTASLAASTGPLHFSGKPIVGQEDATFTPDVTLAFDWDETCTTGCDLSITLTYNDSGGLDVIGQVLSGALFDSVDAMGNLLALSVDRSSSTAILGATSRLVGNRSTKAVADLGDDISPHWGYTTQSLGGFGTNVISATGDILWDLGGVDTLTDQEMFGGTPSQVERSRPGGSSFSLVDSLTCSPEESGGCGTLKGGFQKPDVYVQNELVVTLRYDSEAAIADIDNVAPMFGTTGAPLLPEPRAAVLFATGLLVAGRLGRRSRAA